MELNVLKMAVGADQGPPIPPGVRMHGTYAAQSGFNVEFYDESVIVACGEPARAYPYHVMANGSQTAVKVDDPGHPLLLNIRSDGSLDPGTGQYLVHGRKIIGKDENDDFKFAPLEATCNLGVLVPGAGAGAPAGVRVTASTAPAGSSGAATGNAVLSVVSGFATQPGAANPFAGRTFVLLRDNFDNVLAKGGFSVPAGVQPYKAMILACSQRAPDCQKASAAIGAQTATGGKLDATGKATFSGVAPGSYYLMGSALAGGQALMWDVKVDLKAGANSVTLDQWNATTVK
jgi:hypothetical protein